MKNNWLIALHLALNITAYHLNDRLYFLFIALSWLCIPILLYLNGFKDKLVLIFLFFSFNNIVDELLKCNTYKQVSEYIFALLIIIVLCRKSK